MDDQNLQPTQVDAEVIETPEITTTNNSDVLLSLDTMIKSHIKSIDTLTAELKKKREMLEDSFQNDPVFREHSEQAKKAAQTTAETKAQISKQPQVMQLTKNVKDVAAELKALKAELSDYLLEFQRLSGATMIEGDDGDIREITLEAKLVKRSSAR